MNELKAKALKGLTDDERSELAAYYIPFAKAIAKRYSRNSDDYFGPALYGIAYAIDNPREDMDSWVKSCIIRCVRNFYARDQLVKIPTSTKYDKRAKGIEMSAPKYKPIDDSDIKILNLKYRDAILDALDEVSQDDIDRAIIDLRLEGYVDAEIGMRLSLSQKTVQRRRTNLENRYYKRVA